MPDRASPSLSPVQRALLAVEDLQAKLEALRREPLAVIGMGCRLPGNADSPEAFWRLLAEGTDAIREVPPDRWDVEAYYDADPQRMGKIYTRNGGFIEQVDAFDAEFFGVSPREATCMDPQQRLFLEVGWEALERAGQTREQLLESATGVFVGISANDYARFFTERSNADAIDAYFVSGNSLSAAAGRLSYFLGLHGPSLAVDTACSSSLVAVHLACQSLRQRECDLALAGGVNLILKPENSVATSRAHMLSSDGRCKTFDASADGYGRGEGCGVVVLKRLSDAVRDGDGLLAVIRSSMVNHDGLSSAFTVPNGPAQQALIRQALEQARIAAAEVDYVEAHGTGTSLGDPIEIGALGAVFGKDRPADRPLYVGSVKTNIGHLESAAGIAGLIKVVLALQHERVPRHLHQRQPNPHIPWDELPLRVPSEAIPWPAAGRRRRAGVSSFGASGTNAHVLVEDASSPVTPSEAPAAERPLHVLTVSARSEAALRAAAARYAAALENLAEQELGDFCFTANARRSHFEHRLALVVESASVACDRLRSYADTGEGAFVGHVVVGRPPRPVLCFPDAAPSGREPGLELMCTQPLIREAFERCEQIVSAWSISLRAATAPGTREGRCLALALQHALASMWQAWGLRPAAVLGWGVGEYTAACFSGVMQLSDAFRSLAQPDRELSAMSLSAPQVPIVSLETGNSLGDEVLEYGYWRRIAEKQSWSEWEPSRLRNLAHLRQRGLELRLLIGASEPSTNDTSCLASLRAGHDDLLCVLQSLAALYVRGVVVDWAAFDRPYERQAVVLPTYPFQRSRHWVETPAALPQTTADVDPAYPLLQNLRDGETEKLAQQMTALGTWSAAEQTALRKVLATLSEHVRQHAALAGTADWLYEVSWQPMSGTPHVRSGGAANASQCGWLIFADQQGVADQLQTRLRAQGHCVWLVRHGSAPVDAPRHERFIDPADAEAYRLLLGDAADSMDRPLEVIIHLWSLDAPALEESRAVLPDDALVLGCRSGLHTVQALAAAGQPGAATLWFVTRGAVPAATRDRGLALQQTPVWGLGKVVALEHPEFWGGIVDLDPDGFPVDVDTILQLCRRAGEDDALAVRGGSWYRPRLIRHALPAQETQPDWKGTILISGGLGALGLRVAGWMVEQGARHLALVGRRPSLKREIHDLLESWARMGVKAVTLAADVAQPEELARVLSEIDSTMPPLEGIVHAAGVIDDGVLAQQDWDRFLAVMRPKVQGAWNLHALTSERPLKFFVCFSSAAALLGAPGQSNYVVANTFLDMLAHHRRALGLPGLSINWGPWATAGMAADLKPASQRRIAQRGVTAIEPERGVALFGHLLSQSMPQLGVVAVHWAKYAATCLRGRRSPLLSKLLPQDAIHNRVARDAVLLLGQAPVTARPAILVEYLKAEVGRILGFDSSRLPGANQGFFDMGMDSLVVVELKNRLQQDLGVDLSSSALFDHPTIEQLAQHLLADVLALGRTESPEEQARAAAPGATFSEPVAIVGVGCRFPGDASNPDAFWRNLCNGVDAVGEVPADRWDVMAHYDPNPDAAGKMYSLRGGFLDRVDGFDSLFFGISPREAERMDPQQRLLLEVSWEALESAGRRVGDVSSSRVGVFIGIGSNDYGNAHIYRGDNREIDVYSGTGNSQAFAAGRLSYQLGLHGPSIAVDTACSSSMVAIHLASRSLQGGECELALAGGVSLMLEPESSIFLSRAKALSPDGRCKTFDADADGYVRGEGCGVLVLKPFSKAQADGDHIWALIRGSAVNHDGASSGLTVPNGTAQQALLRQALQQANVEPHDVSYIEAHGTGTSLGDPIEVNSLGAVYGAARPADRPLYIASVKTNIGHLEAAAGVAGVVKTVLALQNQEIPPHLHFHSPNPQIDWDKLPLRVPTARTPWPAGKARRLAAVSSFGLSGTNTHVILEEAPGVEPADVDHRPLHILTLSAKSEQALAELARRYTDFLASSPAASLADICYTANCGRVHFAHRLAIVASSLDGAARQLEALCSGSASGEALPQVIDEDGAPRVIWCASGASRPADETMRTLYSTQPTFRRALDRCEIDLGNDADPLVSFAFQYALADMWAAWGVSPHAICGRGLGAYVAACRAGVFDLETVLRALRRNRRGELIPPLSGTAPRIPLLSPLTGEMTGPEITRPEYWSVVDVTDAGPISALALADYDVLIELGPGASPEGRLRRPTAVIASTMDWRALLNGLQTLYLRGVPIDWEGFDRDYYRRRVTLPTYPFQRERYWLASGRADGGSANGVIGGNAAAKFPLLGRRLALPSLAATVFSTHLSTEAFPLLGDHRIFDRVVVPGAAYLAMLLAAPISAAGGAPPKRLEDVLFHQALVLADDDVVELQTIIERWQDGKASFKIISLDAEGNETEDAAETATDEYTVHATGTIVLGSEQAGVAGTVESIDIEAIQARSRRRQSGNELYRELAVRGVDLGPGFRWIDSYWPGDGEVLGRMCLPAALADEDGTYPLHPALIDACFQLLAGTAQFEVGETRVPFSVAECRLLRASRASAPLWCHGLLRNGNSAESRAGISDLYLYDSEGDLLAKLISVESRPANRSALLRSPKDTTAAAWYDVSWLPEMRESSSQSTRTGEGAWLIFHPGGDFASQLGEEIRHSGDQCALFHADPRDNEAVWRAFRRKVEECDGACRGVICLPPEISAGEEVTLHSLQRSIVTSCGAALHLVQAMLKTDLTSRPRLVLVSRGVQPVATAPLARHIAQAPMWGLGRALAWEHPEFGCLLIDLDPEETADDARHLAGELQAAGWENQIAFRRGMRYVARLRKSIPRLPAEPPRLHSDATYLITGGLGALGLEVAAWMVARGARRLILCGRHGARTQAATALIEDLRAKGSRVTVVQADISDPGSAAALFETIKASCPSLRGIIHAAGLLDDGVLRLQSWDRFDRVLAPKVAGAWNLHCLTSETELDFFVCFSSAASLWGAAGQANYAAANAFLDALAHARRGCGRPAVSINWGPWDGLGMAAAGEDRNDNRKQALGVLGLSPAEGIKALGALLTSDRPQVGVVRMRWQRLFAALAEAEVPSLFSELQGALDATRPLPTSSAGKLRAELEKLNPRKARRRLFEATQQEVASVLGFSDPHRLAPRAKLFELGLDSLMAVSLRNRFQQLLATSLPPTLVFDYPSIDRLVESLYTSVIAGQEQKNADAIGANESSPTASAAELSALSEREMEALLLEKIMAVDAKLRKQ